MQTVFDQFSRHRAIADVVAHPGVAYAIDDGTTDLLRESVVFLLYSVGAVMPGAAF